MSKFSTTSKTPDLETVKKEIRAILQSQKGGVDAAFLQKDYKDLIGSYIPHRAFGYHSLIEFICSLTDVARVTRSKDGDIMCHAVANTETAHIQKMVSRQRGTRKKKKKKPKVFSAAHLSNYKHNPFSSYSQYPGSGRWTSAYPRNYPNKNNIIPQRSAPNRNPQRQSGLMPENPGFFYPFVPIPIHQQPLLNVSDVDAWRWHGYWSAHWSPMWDNNFVHPPRMQQQQQQAPSYRMQANKKTTARPNTSAVSNPARVTVRFDPEPVEEVLKPPVKPMATPVVSDMNNNASTERPATPSLRLSTSDAPSIKSPSIVQDAFKYTPQPKAASVTSQSPTPQEEFNYTSPQQVSSARSQSPTTPMNLSPESQVTSRRFPTPQSKTFKRPMPPASPSVVRSNSPNYQNTPGYIPAAVKKPSTYNPFMSDSEKDKADEEPTLDMNSNETKTPKPNLAASFSNISLNKEPFKFNFKPKTPLSPIVWDRNSTEPIPSFDKISTPSKIDQATKTRIQQLVKSFENGLQSTALADEYFDEYKIPLKRTIVLDLECGNIPGVVAIERIKLGNTREKIIFKHLDENKFHGNVTTYEVPQAPKLTSGTMNDEVIITHIEAWDKIYIRRTSDVSKFNQLLDQSEYDDVQAPIKPGSFANIQGTTTRCRVLEITKNRVILLNVDTGETFSEVSARVISLPESMSKLHALAIRCKMHTQSSGQEWSSIPIQKFEDMLLDRMLDIRVLGHEMADNDFEIIHSVIFYDNDCNLNNSLRKFAKTPVKIEDVEVAPSVAAIKPEQLQASSFESVLKVEDKYEIKSEKNVLQYEETHKSKFVCSLIVYNLSAKPKPDIESSDEELALEEDDIASEGSVASILVPLTSEDEVLLKHQPAITTDIPDTCEVGIFSVESTTCVKACVMESEHLEEFPLLEESMKKFYSSVRSVMKVPLKVGAIYAAKIPAVDPEAVYRVRLTGVTEKGLCQVYLVDYDESYDIPSTNIHLLIEEFAKLPCQVVTLSLALLEHDVLATDSEVLQFLEDTIVGGLCFAQVVCRSKSLLKPATIVMLYDTSSEEEVNINRNCLLQIQEEELAPTISQDCSWFDALITNIALGDGTAKVWFQIPGDGLALLNKLETRSIKPAKKGISSLCKFSMSMADNLYVGKRCICYVNSTKTMQRVEIRDISKKQKMKGISVFLLDYGTTKEVARSNLKKIPDDEQMITLPPQAVCCSLSPSNNSQCKTQILDESLAKTLRGSNVKIQTSTSDPKEEPVISVMLMNGEEEVILLPPPHGKIKIDVNEAGDHNNNLKTGSNLLLNRSMISEDGSVCSLTSELSKNYSLMSGEGPHVNAGNTSQSSIHGSRNDLSQSAILARQFTSISPIHVNGDAPSSARVSPVAEAQQPSPSLKTAATNAADMTLTAVKVLHFISPSEFYVLPLESVKYFDELTVNMTAFYDNSLSLKYVPKSIQVKSIYAVRRLIGNTMKWCRGEVEAILGNDIAVNLIDLGISGNVKVSDMRYLKQEFCARKRLAMECAVCGLIPALGEKWSVEIISNVKNKLEGLELFCHIDSYKRNMKSHRSPCAQVFLYDTNCDSGVCINDQMVDAGYAIWDKNFKL